MSFGEIFLLLFLMMDHHAVLGPVDPQVASFPAASVLAAVGRKHPDRVEDRTLILADIAEKAIAQVKSAVEELLREHMPEPEAERVAAMAEHRHVDA